jgi:hypothetical protein
MDEVIAAEEQAKREIKEAIKTHGNDIAALIIETVQGEGGDNHFRPEFLRFLREITLENEIMFISDEVQAGRRYHRQVLGDRARGRVARLHRVREEAPGVRHAGVATHRRRRQRVQGAEPHQFDLGR